jgi:thiol-disulfide isomerase/thioredoxin
MTNLQRRKLLTYLGLGAIGAGATALAPSLLKSAPQPSDKEAPGFAVTTRVASPIASPSPSLTLPNFQGISEWLNSDPLTVAELKGNVVLIQFWTFACINCQRTLPYIVKWHQQYADQGLKVIGVHTPEFAFEREIGNVKKALEEHQITYPVPIDGEFKTWKAYDNSYWPHLYLADRQGNIRYDHIGEGAYDTTEQTIQQLISS